jgi:hypothetical protein
VDAANPALELIHSQTNNFIEAHFNSLKNLLGRISRRRIDDLLHLLLTTVDGHYRGAYGVTVARCLAAAAARLLRLLEQSR